MLTRLGFVASVLTENLSASRTCRLSNATPARLRELTAQNLWALDQILTFLERYDIHLYRISSNVIPFASHKVNRTKWWTEFAPDLRRLGKRIRRLGIRVSLHPGQYTVLNSPNPETVKASIAELTYQARFLDSLDVGRECKIVLHIGGLYAGSEAAAMATFIERAGALPKNVLQRLVVENDDRLFDADEVLLVSRALKVPMVFDWLHHQANPCARAITGVLPDIFDTWTAADGRPKVHLSTQARGGPPGAHADDVDADDLLAFLRVAPGRPFDCMLEAKEKDRALLRLREELRLLGIVEADLACSEETAR